MRNSFCFPILFCLLLLLPCSSYAAVDNIYDYMTDAERNAGRTIRVVRTTVARPTFYSALLGDMISNQSGFILRRGFGLGLQFAVAVTLAMELKDMYDAAHNDPDVGQYFKGVSQVGSFSADSGVGVVGSITGTGAGTYQITGRLGGGTYTGVVNNTSPCIAMNYVDNVCTQVRAYSSTGENKWVFSTFQIVPAQAPPPPDLSKYSYPEFEQEVLDDLSRSDGHKKWPMLEPYGVDAAMDSGNAKGQVSMSPSSSDVEAASSQQQAADQKAEADQAKTNEEEARQNEQDEAKSEVERLQAAYDAAKAAADADPANSDKAKAAADALAALNAAKGKYNISVSAAASSTADKEAAEAQAAEEAAAGAAAQAQIQGDNNYDPSIDLPEQKSIANLIGSFVSLSPLVQMVNSFNIQTSSGVSSVNAGTVYGQVFNIDFSRYEGTFSALGGVLLLISHGFAVFIVIRGW